MKIIDDRTPKKKKLRDISTKKYKYQRLITYKAGDIVGNKTIIRYVASRGGHHYYSVRCGNCNRITTTHQEVLFKGQQNATVCCRKCTASYFRRWLDKLYPGD